MAAITEDFSFAYMKEAFVATLLELARDHDDDSDEESDGDDGDDPLDDYELWRVFKAQVKILREEMGDGTGSAFTSNTAEAPPRHEGPPGRVHKEHLGSKDRSEERRVGKECPV